MIFTVTSLMCSACSVFFVASLLGCKNSKPTRSLSIPDNVIEDRPIVIKEGQAIIFMSESKQSLMIGASVVDGKLSVSEIDPKGKSFSVTWYDEDTWETSVVDSDEDQTKMIIDKNGDGIPELRVITDKISVSRFQLDDPKWIELR